MKKLSLLGLTVLLVLSGCSPINTPPPTVPADQAQDLATQVDAMSENLLIALNNRDETAMLEDMDADMRQASAGQTEELYQAIVGKIGPYAPGSKQMVKVEEVDTYRRVFYDATFDQEEHVQVLVVYNLAGDQPLVSGLWFDSPKLRQ